MDNATATIDPREAALFGTMAADWWDPRGSSAMLHRLNPVRLAFIREAVDMHFGTDSHALRPLTGKRALDAGCGAGLLCEPLARMGAAVTGVDAAAENVAAAKAHAEAMGLLAPLPFRGGAWGGVSPAGTASNDSPHPNPSPEACPEPSRGGEGLASATIRYLHGDLADLALTGFDLVCSLEVIEHVADKGLFLRHLAQAMAPGGLMILSCPNRTPRSRLLLVEAAERLGRIPRGTHDWNRFPTPPELRELLSAAGMEMGAPRGIAWSPVQGLHLSADLSLNYIVTARRA